MYFSRIGYYIHPLDKMLILLHVLIPRLTAPDETEITRLIEGNIQGNRLRMGTNFQVSIQGIFADSGPIAQKAWAVSLLANARLPVTWSEAFIEERRRFTVTVEDIRLIRTIKMLPSGS